MREMFNNREIAIAIWTVIAIAGGLVYPSIRKAVTDVLKAFFKLVILVPLSLIAIYIGLVVYGLFEIGLWHAAQLKNTILWGVSVAAVSLFRIDAIVEDPHYFRKAIIDNLKLITILEFIIAFYTFPLWVELLIVPAITILVSMQVIADNQKEFKLVGKVLNIILILFGFMFFLYACFKLFSDFSAFATPNTFMDFVIPPLLSIFFIPFLLIIRLYAIYEKTFIQIHFAIDDPPLRAFAKRQAIFEFRTQTKQLKRWVRNLMDVKPKNKCDIKKTIRDVKVFTEGKSNPPTVSADPDWSS